MGINAWKEYANDFDNLTDEEIHQETMKAERDLDEAESWLEAVASWNAAGRPRSVKKDDYHTPDENGFSRADEEWFFGHDGKP